MNTTRVASDLAAVMVPLGYAGAVFAVICALVAAVAIVRGNGGLTGGAVGVWIVCALLSLVASFASDWLPPILAGSALVVLLAAGGVVKWIVSATSARRAEQLEIVEAESKAVESSGATSKAAGWRGLVPRLAPSLHR